MNFKTKLDFCVIPSPYSRGEKSLVFVAYSGTNKVDEKLCEEQDYELLKFTLRKFGYQEIDYCVFQSADNYSIEVNELKHRLAEAGLRYSKPFEFNIMSEMDSLHKEATANQEMFYGHHIDENVRFYLPSPVDVNKPKFKVPAVGEKVSMYFYLFLQCHFINENDCILELVGDLYSKENNNTRNYLQIIKSDFICLESKIPHAILIKSTKTYKDFINELNFLHKGSFKFVKPIINQDGDTVLKSKEFIYNIMEVKKNINPVHKISMEVNLNQYFDAINMSKKIKKELSMEQKKIVSLDVLRPEVLMLKQKLKDKMINLAEADEFEKANVIKKDINFIDNKLSVIDNFEEKNITNAEYLKTFCLNS